MGDMTDDAERFQEEIAEMNQDMAAAESQEERDAENAIIPDITKVTDLSEIPEPQPHFNGYSGPMTK